MHIRSPGACTARAQAGYGDHGVIDSPHTPYYLYCLICREPINSCSLGWRSRLVVARAHELGEPVLVTGSLYLLGDIAAGERQ